MQAFGKLLHRIPHTGHYTIHGQWIFRHKSQGTRSVWSAHIRSADHGDDGDCGWQGMRRQAVRIATSGVDGSPPTTAAAAPTPPSSPPAAAATAERRRQHRKMSYGHLYSHRRRSTVPGAIVRRSVPHEELLATGAEWSENRRLEIRVRNAIV